MMLPGERPVVAFVADIGMGILLGWHMTIHREKAIAYHIC
jgi:hypothetical protein